VIIFGRKSKARLVPDGRFEKRKCPECEKTAVFRECLVANKYHVFFVVDVFDTESTKFACDRCGSVMDLDDTLDPELTEKEKQQAAIAAKEAAIAAKQRQLEQQKARDREAAKAQNVEDELAAMKKRLGID
jgi:ribosomal protein S27E